MTIEMEMRNEVSAGRRRAVRWRAVLLAALFALVLPTSAFAAPASLVAFDATTSTSQAGARADIGIDVDFERGVDPETSFWDFDNIRTIEIDLPPGLAGDAARFPTCSRQDFIDKTCTVTSQVGTAHLDLYNLFGGTYALDGPLYLVQPAAGQPAVVGFNIGGLFAPTVMTVRPRPDYGITATTSGFAGSAFIASAEYELWGIPADHGVPGPRTPFMSYPTQCDTAPTVRVRARTYARSDTWMEASDDLPVAHGCDGADFEPDIDVRLDNPVPDQPSGLAVDITVPDGSDPGLTVQAHLKKAVVTLPEGVSMSPAAANGLVGCSDAQIGLTADGEPTCPLASKIGTVSIETPALATPLSGSVFVGTQTPGHPYRIFIVAQGSGVTIKLPGSIDADPRTGRLTVTFDDNPQLPFTKLSLRLKPGPRAPLATSPTCGVKAAAAEFTSWSGKTKSVMDQQEISGDGIGGPCVARPFAPGFEAGSVNPVGGDPSPFLLRVDRPDTQQYLGGVSVDLPPGLLAKIRGVAKCGDDDAAAGTCPSTSRVGTATVAVGPGSTPLRLSGPVSLTGPYKDAPLGLAVAIRAVAGPYDLGTVVVRQALHIDPVDASATVASDPLPTILEGIPIRLRRLEVDIDRPGFTVNPTSCDEGEVGGKLTSMDGAMLDVGNRFQVGDCAALGFAPRLALRLTGRKQRQPGRHPGLRAVLTQPDGQANVDAVKVKLPRSIALDPGNADTLCGYEDGLRATCPAASRIGRAVAHSPLLNEPLAGPVHFVQGVRFDRRTGNRIRTLPTLLMTLRGEIAIDLRARSSVSGGRLVSTFPTVPDAPVSKFSLVLKGGKGGILAVTGERNLCAQRNVAAVQTDGHNGKQADFRTAVRTPCAKKKPKRGGRR